MTDATEIVTAAVAVLLLGAGAITERLRRRPPPLLRCLGYLRGETLFDDCHARQSPSCLDGRCSYHCGRMCRCSSPEFGAVEVEVAPETARSVRR